MFSPQFGADAQFSAGYSNIVMIVTGQGRADHFPLPMRAGPRPAISPRAPYVPVEQHPPREIADLVRRFCLALSGVTECAAVGASPGTTAFCVSGQSRSSDADTRLLGEEFCHLHPLPAGSLYFTLPSMAAVLAVEHGWAELHSMAASGAVPELAVLFYAARNTLEFSILTAFLTCSHAFASGVWNGHAMSLWGDAL